jgi:hypothetical protein
MPVPSYGALPLSETFLCIRGLSLVAIVGTLSIVGNPFCIYLISTNPHTDLHRNPVHSDQHSILHGSSKFGLVRHDCD